MKSNTRQDYLDRICRVLRFVQEHLDEDLSPAILSDVANLSVYHFHRIFSGLVGESLAEHVRRLRLEWARSRGPAVLRNVFERCEDDAARGSDDADLDSIGGSV
jgi:AraC family transcriptional regulator